MLKLCSKELCDFMIWLNKKYPCTKDVRVIEVNSLDGKDVKVKRNGKIKLRRTCIFHNGLGLYRKGVEEIYVASSSLAKSILDIPQEENMMVGYKGFEQYTVTDYMLETFAHEYCHHLQFCDGFELKEEEAEQWCKRIFLEYTSLS